MNTMRRNDYLSATEAAREIGVSNSSVHKWIKRGELKAERVDSIYQIQIADFTAFRVNYKNGKYIQQISDCIDSFENIQICLNCQVPGECNPKSHACGLRKKTVAAEDV